MPSQYNSGYLIHTDPLERLYGPYTDETEAKHSVFNRIKFQKAKYLEHVRPGAWFTGVQMSQSHRYSVTVRLQDVNLDQSTLSGYLTIEGLTDEYPSLTTFFEAEIIGKRHKFQTRKWVNRPAPAY